MALPLNPKDLATEFPPWLFAIGSMLLLLLLSHFSRVRLCATPWTAAHQAPPSLGFSRQENWSGLPFPSPVHESEKWKWSRSVVPDSLRPHGLQPTRLLRPWGFPGSIEHPNLPGSLSCESGHQDAKAELLTLQPGSAGEASLTLLSLYLSQSWKLLDG